MKTLLSEYKKSKNSGWKYQPKMKVVNGVDLKVGDLVTERYSFNERSSILKYRQYREVTAGQLFEGIDGNRGMYIQQNGLIPFNNDLKWYVLDLEGE